MRSQNSRTRTSDRAPVPSRDIGPAARAGVVLLTLAVLASCGSAPEPLSFNADGITIAASLDEGVGSTTVGLLITPDPGAKLAANPGMTLTPSEGSAVEWLTELPIVAKEEDGYWKLREFELEFSGAGPATLDLDYAYCYVESLCFLRSTQIDLAEASGGELDTKDEGLRETDK